MRGVLSSGGKPRQYAPTSQLPRLGGRDPAWRGGFFGTAERVSDPTIGGFGERRASRPSGTSCRERGSNGANRRTRAPAPVEQFELLQDAIRDRLKKPARTFQWTAGRAKKSQGRTPVAGRRSLPLGLFWMRRGGRKRMRARLSAQTMLCRLVQSVCKIVRHGRQAFSEISAAMLEMFAAIRERCTRVTRRRRRCS